MSATFETGSLFSASVAVANGLKVRALCAHEGQFTSQSGTRKKFTPKLLNTIAAASNEHLESGEQTPLFFGNHDFDPTNKVGFVVGPYEGKVITETDLPDPKLTDLIGKYGIFTQIELLDDGAIAKYQSKLIKPISMSVDYDGERFTKNAIFEISIVGLAAFPGAQLFSKSKSSMKIDFKAMAAQALELRESYGLTMDKELAEGELMPKLYKLFEAFTSVIREIDEEELEDSERQRLIQQAISDLSIGVASRLSVAAPAASYSMSLDDDPSKGNKDPDDETPEEEDMAQIEELKAQIEELKQTKELQEAYSTLHNKAGELVDKGYLEPVKYHADFKAASFSTKDVTEKFGRQDLGTAIAAIKEKTTELAALEKYSAPVRMGTRVKEELDPDDKDVKAAEEFMASYSIKSPLGKY